MRTIPKYTVSLFLCLSIQPVDASPVDSLWQTSLEKFRLKDYHGSVSDLNQVIRLQPDAESAYYNRGVAGIFLAGFEMACRDLKRAHENGMSESTKLYESYCRPETIALRQRKSFYPDTPLSGELGWRPIYTRADTLRGSLSPPRTCYDVHYYNLLVKVNPSSRSISGSNQIWFEVKEPTRSIQVDLFDRFAIHSITWNQMELTFTREYQALFVDFPEELVPGDRHMIEISYSGKPLEAANPPWEGGFVWEKDSERKPWIGVACEHLGASSWWPNKDHLSDKPDSMLIRIAVPAGMKAIANGNLRQVKDLKKRYRQFDWFVSYPINTYNVTFYAGQYASISDTLISCGDTLMLDYNVLEQNLGKAREHFKQTGRVIDFYNRAFGFYPFKKDGFGLVESPYEGMEHQSAIAYGNNYDATNYYGYRTGEYDFIIVHEAAHEWWGNSVTAADMADAWIHEGFATYAEYLFLEDTYGPAEYLYELTDKSRFIMNLWPLVQNRNVNENTFLSNDVYHKGAMLLHCLRCIVNNDSLFSGMLRTFCMENKYKAIDSDDFIAYSSRITDTDLRPFFHIFLYDTRLPLLDYSFKKQGSDLLLRYRWTGVIDGFTMPFSIATSSGESIRISATVQWQETLLPGTDWFRFHNLYSGSEGSAVNGFTYYETNWLSEN